MKKVVILSEAEYNELAAKARSWDALTPPPHDPEAVSFHVPVPLDVEASGSDWRAWSKYLLPERLKACTTAAEVQAVLDANKDSLDTVKVVSAPAYAALAARGAELIGRLSA